MAVKPSRSVVPAFARTGFLDSYRHGIVELFAAGQVRDAVDLALASARMAELLGDLPTAVVTRLTAGLTLANLGGRRVEVEAVVRSVLAQIHTMAPVETSGAPGSGVQLEGLPAHARFWRAQALALLARCSLDEGRMLTAMDALADALALLEGCEPSTEDDAVACLALAMVLTRILLVEPAAELAARAERLATLLARANDAASLRIIWIALARCLAETHTLWACYLDLTGDQAKAERRYGVAASAARRFHRVAVEIDSTDEQDAAILLVEFAELGLSRRAGHRCDPASGSSPADLAHEEAIRSALQRLPPQGELPLRRGQELIGRIGLARLLAARGEREQARAVLGVSDPTTAGAWADVLDVVRAELEDAAHHPAVALWRDLAVAALARVWRERGSRFVDLRQRIAQRQLRWRRAATEGELLRDPLTGLGNRRRLAVELDREVSSVLFIDVDRFKRINDDFSHEIGDLVLRRLAGILRSCCRSPDVIIRYGGDEFVVLLGRGSNASALGERVLDRVRGEDWSTLTGGHAVTVSVGAAAALTLHDALRQSDAAMLAAKQAGRNSLVLGGR